VGSDETQRQLYFQARKGKGIHERGAGGIKRGREGWADYNNQWLLTLKKERNSYIAGKSDKEFKKARCVD